MKTNEFDLNKIYVSGKNLISRLNQDATAIVMRTDNSDVFYKLTGLSALYWHIFISPTKPADVIEILTQKFKNVDRETIKNDFVKVLNELNALNFFETTDKPINSNKLTELNDIFSKISNYDVGQISNYNLAQIEAEVLNESIYLDVFAGSDMRIKHNVEPLQNSLSKVTTLDGISFLWSEQNAPKTEQVGLVAQQVAEVMPELVRRDSQTGVLAVNYTKLTPYLVESIKELKKLIDAQTEKISALEAELKKLKH